MFGFDRTTVPGDPELIYQRHRAFYEDLRGRPIRSRPLFHRDPSIEPIPSRFDPPLDVPPRIVPGTGLLRLVVDAAMTMPVSLVDGEPVAVGDGTHRVFLPTGWHVVEVQGSDTCSPVVVRIEEEGLVSLIWREEADRRTRCFGPPRPDPNAAEAPSHWYATALHVFIIGAPLMLMCGSALNAAAAAVLGFVMAGIVVILLLLFLWRWRGREWPPPPAPERPEWPRIAHHPWGAPARSDHPALLGERPERLPRFAPGTGALILRLRAHRHLWKDGDGVCDRDGELAALRVRPPTVRIDGIEQPATWGNWWYPMQPGPHEVEIACDAVLVAPRGIGDGAVLVERASVEVAGGEVTVLRASAHVFAHREEDGGMGAGEGRLYVRTEDPPVERSDGRLETGRWI